MGREITWEQIKRVCKSDTVKEAAKLLDDIGLLYLFFEIFPQYVIEDRIISKGKNKGMRKITLKQCKLNQHAKDILSWRLTGMPSKDMVITLDSFMANEQGQTMFNLVLGRTAKDSKDFDYQCHWYSSWIKHQGLRDLLIDPLKKYLAKDDKLVARWYEKNSDRYVDMSGDEFNAKWFGIPSPK